MGRRGERDPPVVLYFSIKVTLLFLETPFLISPRGERFFAPSPVGEGWEGGNIML